MDTSKEQNNIDPETKPTDSNPAHQSDADTETDDIELETDAEFSSMSTKDTVAKLRAKLKKSDEEKREYLLGWQKMKADYINTRKQDEEERKQLVKFAEADLISEIIPVLDSFEMAFGNPKLLEGVPDDWRKGMEQVHSQLKSVLTEHGLTIIDPKGSTFNPHEAEAVGVTETDDQNKDDTVEMVFQKGYKLNDRVIRPAKVKVWKHN